MRLSQASDFALRILMLLANEKAPITVNAIAEKLGLVKSHVMKIVAKLVKAGILVSRKGRTGGVDLGRKPSDITLGQVVREIEADFAVVECMQDKKCNCFFLPDCKLKSVMNGAKAAFMDVLDNQNLASVILQPAQIHPQGHTTLLKTDP